MANITAAMVKDLRERSGAGMMDCKKALAEADGDMEAAIDWLRKKGLSKAAKKAGRVAADGLVGVAAAASGDGMAGVAIEVNSETDFVARNETFQQMVAEIAKIGVSVGGDLEQLAAAAFPGTDKTVTDHIAEMVGSIGENMTLRRAAGVAVEAGVTATYVHGQAAPDLGKIGVVVGLSSTGDKEKLTALGRQIAMHVAAARPLAAKVEDLDQAAVQRERDVLIEQAKASGKPDNIIEKMVEGRLRKYYEEVVLLEQIFVIDGETKVAKVLKNAEADVGAPIELAGFVRLELGEGVEKEESDFAAEVAAATSG